MSEVVASGKLVDEAWLDSFTIVNLVRQEIFSELFQIKMIKGLKFRLLRRIKKAIFKRPLEGVVRYRRKLEEMLKLEHPNII